MRVVLTVPELPRWRRCAAAWPRASPACARLPARPRVLPVLQRRAAVRLDPNGRPGPVPDRPVPDQARPGPAGRELHDGRPAAGTRPSSARPGQGGAARPDRHRGHRQHLRRRGAAPRPDPPLPPGGGLGQAEALRLHAAIMEILRAAVDSGGTSFAGYVNEARGRPGYLGQAHVFRRQGLPCPAWGTPIIRGTVAGRATNYCPHCQQRRRNEA